MSRNLAMTQHGMSVAQAGALAMSATTAMAVGFPEAPVRRCAVDAVCLPERSAWTSTKRACGGCTIRSRAPGEEDPAGNGGLRRQHRGMTDVSGERVASIDADAWFANREPASPETVVAQRLLAEPRPPINRWDGDDRPRLHAASGAGGSGSMRRSSGSCLICCAR